MSDPKPTAQGEETRRKILEYIIDYKTWNDGNSPTIRQIADAVGLSSTSSVKYALQTMSANGTIEIISDRYKAMNIRIPGATWTPPEETNE